MPLQFDELLKEKGIDLTPQQHHQYATYYQLLVEWNEKINLTAITDEKNVYLKHFYDSVTPSFWFEFKQPLSICDVGAGAGFPSIPLKILFPELKITIVDSLKKRLTFLEELVRALGLSDVELHHDRAETFGQNIKYREAFDVVTARAVARLNILSEFCLPLTKVGGSFIALKGAVGEEEVTESKQAISLLGGKLKDVHSLTLPEEDSQRQIIIISKLKPTPKKYPRKPGIPTKQPL